MVPFGEAEHLFYGVGSKVFYQQSVYASSANESEGELELSFWSPQVTSGSPSISLKGGKWTVYCGDRETPLIEVSDKERERILSKAQFKKPLWTRNAYALARDDDGVYYYVDRLDEANGGGGFRLYRGRKGKLTLQKMKDVVHDSGGDIFATSTGDLRLIMDQEKSTWVARGKKKDERTDLKVLPVIDNRGLIYGELGVYSDQRLGTPCDDL